MFEILQEYTLARVLFLEKKQARFFVVASKSLKNLKIGVLPQPPPKANKKGQSQRRKAALSGADPGFTASRERN
jgi:hypothetical protein